ncbi:MAG: aminoacyl-tRNA hydrolase [Candidatus Kerfeldbacteria bacterium CG08_land_8_20_14_0_20_42_7]|uniref:Peptidyl-tRNA hydrolase n=1 Tax=Candidatus Kerfeldbacteria bacterium CG08_land_8_20_14_0_20_42_7 TaxID=2014245 RepID=A0A2H0YS80_9BACT|nr:MAG: aminoacyl-tRNA hydrolase [Candidatus Kerfeldbacteria bacterium CG08_land_8_20_14_0_20_42_7]
MHDTQLIIGLGNPGKQYEHTRHNIGFLVVDAFTQALKLGAFSYEQKFSADVLQSGTMRIAKPLTFMNESGVAVQKLVSYFHIDPARILIVHDELDLPFGTLRLQFGRGPAGHNGVASIHTHLRTTDFWRLRIGIKPQDVDDMNPERFVVSTFTPNEAKQLLDVILQAVAAIKMIQSDGTEKTIQFLHSKTPA